MRHPPPSILFLITLFLPMALWANSVNSPLATSAAVANDCQIETLDSLDLGSYQPLSGTPLVGSGQITLKCTKGTVANAIPASGGQDMTGPGGNLAYGLYVDNGFSKPWGSGNATLQIDFSQHAYTVAWGGYVGNVTQQACVNLAQSGPYEYSGSTCWYDLLPPPYTNAAYGQYADYQNLVLNGTQAISGKSQQTIYATGTQVSATVFDLQLSNGTGANPLAGTSTSVNTPIKLTYYAEVKAQQDVVPGVYSDTILVQVTF